MTVVLRGTLHRRAAGELRKFLSGVVAEDPRWLVIDCSELDALEPECLTVVLVAFRRRSHRTEGAGTILRLPGREATAAPADATRHGRGDRGRLGHPSRARQRRERTCA